MRILLIEDDDMLAQHIIKGLSESGYTVLHSANGTEGMDAALKEDYDAAIINLMLPNLDELSIIRRVRGHKAKAPVLVLCAKKPSENSVALIRKGGDDYLTKPFSFSELLTRVEALISLAGEPEPASVLILSDLKLDLLTHKVTRNNIQIDLQPKEFSLLEYLVHNAGHVVSKTMIMERAWNYNFYPSTNVVEAHICKLQEKIDNDFDKPLIHTVPGVGYVMRTLNE